MPTPTNIEIKARFYEAFDKLIELGAIESKTGFCNANGLVGGHNSGTITQLETCAKEVEHLKEIIAEKERLINVLMDKK